MTPEEPVAAATEKGAPSPASRPSRRLSGPMAALLAVALICATGFGFYYLFLRSLEKTRDEAIAGAIGLAESFKPEKIQTTFIEWQALTPSGNEGNVLEVAVAEATETFSSKTNYKLFDRAVPGTQVVTRITVPATYRYHIDLDGPWHMISADQRCIAVAPAVAPSLPVAIDTGKMQKEVDGSWIRIDENTVLDELEASLTGELAERASSEKTIAQIRDEARVSVAKFLRTWLLSHEHWRNDRFNEIVVVFEDEIEDLESYDFASRLPTLRWSPQEADAAGPTPGETGIKP